MAITATAGGGGGGPFATMALWAAYMAGRTLTVDEVWEVSGTISDTALVTIADTNWTPAGHTVTLKAAAAEGISAGGRAWWLTSGRAILTNSVTSNSGYAFSGSTVIVQDLQIEITNSGGNYAVRSGNGAIVQRCIIRSAAGFSAIRDTGGSAGNFKSCLVINTASGGSGAGCDGAGLDLVRCTFVATGGGAGVGISSSGYNIAKVRGCAVIGFATDFTNTALAGSTNNATDKGTFGGTGFGTSGQVSITSADFVSTGSGTEDYTPASGSTKLLETGAVFAGTSVDLFGTSLPQGAINDIGAVERPSSGPTTATLTGPTSGTTGSASSNFTVTLNAAAGSTYTITPAGTNGTVTFVPSSPTITAGNTTVTFTANAALDGAHSISITTSPTLTYSGSPIVYTTSSGGGGTATTASVTLTLDGTSPAANLTGLKWAFFDQVNPGSFATPTAKGTSGTTNSSGVFTTSITGTALTVGATGWLMITNSDGTTTQSPACKSFCAPVTVS
jgi:plastocyanin